MPRRPKVLVILRTDRERKVTRRVLLIRKPTTGRHDHRAANIVFVSKDVAIRVVRRAEGHVKLLAGCWSRRNNIQLQNRSMVKRQGVGIRKKGRRCRVTHRLDRGAPLESTLSIRNGNRKEVCAIRTPRAILIPLLAKNWIYSAIRGVASANRRGKIPIMGNPTIIVGTEKQVWKSIQVIIRIPVVVLIIRQIHKGGIRVILPSKIRLKVRVYVPKSLRRRPLSCNIVIPAGIQRPTIQIKHIEHARLPIRRHKPNGARHLIGNTTNNVEIGIILGKGHVVIMRIAKNVVIAIEHNRRSGRLTRRVKLHTRINIKTMWRSYAKTGRIKRPKATIRQLGRPKKAMRIQEVTRLTWLRRPV